MRTPTSSASSRSTNYRARTVESQDKHNPDYLFRRRSEQRIGSDEPPSMSFESMGRGGRSWSEDRDLMRFFFGYEDNDLDWESLTEDEVGLVILNWSRKEPGSPDPTRQPHTIKVD